MDSSELIPCPFCEGKADFYVVVETPAQGLSGPVKATGHVYCTQCFVRGPKLTVDLTPLKTNEGLNIAIEGVKARIAERWNKRAEDTDGR